MYFITRNTKTIIPCIFLLELIFYRIKAMGDNSAKKGKGYYLGHIPLLYIDTKIGKLCLSMKEYADLHNNGVK